MDSKKRISKLLAKFMLISSAISCFGYCTSAMDTSAKNNADKNSEVAPEILMADEILKHACYTVIVSNDFNKLVRHYILYNNYPNQNELVLKGKLIALETLEDKEKFSALLPQFAKHYVDKIMTKD